MADQKQNSGPLVWVKDKAGNEYLCPIDALKDPSRATEEELKNCVDAIQESIGSEM